MEMVFDTLACLKELKSSGVPEAQAEAHIKVLRELVDEKLATKKDLLAAKGDILAVQEELKRDLTELELKLRRDLTLMIGGSSAATITILSVMMKIL